MQHGAFHHHLHRLVFLLKCGYHFPLEGLWVWKGPAINAREETNSYKNWKLIICALQEIRNISVYVCAYIYMWVRLVYMCVHIYIYVRERERVCTTERYPDAGTDWMDWTCSLLKEGSWEWVALACRWEWGTSFPFSASTFFLEAYL